MLQSFLGLPANDANENTGIAMLDLGAILSAVIVAEVILEWFTPDRAGQHSAVVIIGVVLALVAAISLWLRKAPTLAFGLAWIGATLIYGERFPQAANHHFLVWIVLLCLWCFRLTSDKEAKLALGTVRWLTAIVFFHTGFQKLWYGTYTKGQYFAASFQRQEWFADFFRWAIPEEELTRIMSLGPPTAGAGPFRVDFLPFWVITNSVVLAEIFLPMGLLWPKTRKWAWPLSIALIAGIEIGAREFIFGVIFVSLLFVFRPDNPFRKLRWVMLAVLVSLVLIRIVLPSLVFA